MNSLAFASIKEIKEKLDKKEISKEEVLRYFIKRFERHDGVIDSALEIFDEASILAHASHAGTLAGIPGIIKDNIVQKDRPITCASKILKGFTATYDSTATARLKKEGALLIGRANCDEFAMGSSGETSAYKTTKNPWDIDRVPGGSSSGSAAAVAAGLVPWSLGSDTGGSIRLPAAFCNLVGIKPTYGRVSRYGLIAYGSSMDQIGAFTRNVYDNALVMAAIAGHDAKDSSSRNVPATDYTKELTGSIKPGLKIGIIENALYAEGMDPEIASAVEVAIKHYEKLGAIIEKVKLPMIEYGAATYFIVSRAEAASNLARFDGVRYGLRADVDNLNDMYNKTREEGFGSEVKSRIIVGNYVLSAGHAGQFYQKANDVRAMIRSEFLQAFKSVDVLLMPTHSIPPFKFGSFKVDKLAMDLQDNFTCAANLAHIPALSIPCGFTASKLPIGLQLIGPDFSEGLLYQTAYAYEQSTPWHTYKPDNLD
ncbi:glutamyl-tRNA(Gln) amidotransferase subunit A [Candidatus Dependentiae bacterium Noda2021]|nr:glutamyl-tRNA(Gln) amidotransferase subunit A [Candidatus Dependentiae bacterium Noda2021]